MLGIGVVAAANDTIFTKYHSQEYVSYGYVAVEATLQTAETVVNDLIDDFVGDPAVLFEWALKGLGKADEDKRNELMLILRETKFDKMSATSRITTDIAIADIVVAKNIVIEGKVTQTKRENGALEVNVEIKNSNFFVRKANGTFFVLPQAKGLSYVMRVNVTFGWFVNLFITQQRYSDMIEWRIMGFLKNMREETERRTKI